MSDGAKKQRTTMRTRVAGLEAELAKRTAELDAAIKDRNHYKDQRDALVRQFDSVCNFVESRKTLAIEMVAVPANQG